MMVDRLVYGSARLTGGASAAASERLVRACLEAGVRHFDTAPSYGIGTAEQVLGRCLADRPDVRVTVKVGSRRPRFAIAKTWLRALKAVAGGRESPLGTSFTPQAPKRRAAGGDFSPAAMARSLEESRRRLRRDRFDVLLLHEIFADDVTPEAVAFLEAARASGTAGRVGYSNGALSCAALRAAFPAGFVAQTAVPPESVIGTLAEMPADYLHSIAHTALYAAGIDAGFARWQAEAAGRVPAALADRRSAALAVTYALLHARLPECGLIFASIDADRLGAFLRAVGHIDSEIGAAALAGSAP